MTSTIKVNNIQNQCGANIINENSNTITIGASGDTIALASGASQTGFGREGSVNWQTGSIKTTTFTAASGEGYFVDTSSGAVTVNLPAGSAGAIVAFSDYTRTFGTHALTISPNGSEKIGGVTADAKLGVDGQAATFVYVDSTEGWINVQNAEDTEQGATFIVATGGTVTCSGNCKIHTFTGPGTFCVSAISGIAANNQVSYIVVAGGGAGGDAGGRGAGGGGAGGFREDKSPVTPYTASPLDGAGDITVSATAFPITVGAGGASRTSPNVGNCGSNSIFSTITSAGGGGGGGEGGPAVISIAGGSGGGGGKGCNQGCGANGNTPPVSPPQGNPGGDGGGGSNPTAAGGGGGGATAAGGVGSSSDGGAGGAGATTEINASPTTFAGGGGGSTSPAGGGNPGPGGGGAGGGFPGPSAVAGTANTGGGGGGAADNAGGGAGGSGIVIIRYKFQ